MTQPMRAGSQGPERAFISARRMREIGVRAALGASRGRLVAAIFRRPLTHVILGVLRVER